MEVKTVGIACDHGFSIEAIRIGIFGKEGLSCKGLWYIQRCSSVDYPDFGHALAKGIESGEVYPGIGICGSGEGIAMTLNKHQGVRAGLAWCKEIAHLVRQHNDANVLVLPGRFVDNKTAEAILDEFFATTFEGGRHERRVKKIPVQQ